MLTLVSKSDVSVTSPAPVVVERANVAPVVNVESAVAERVVIELAVMVVPVVIVKSSSIVTAESVSWIAPESDSVVTPDTAPVVVTSNALESIEKLSPLSPRVTTPRAVSVCPLATVSPPFAESRLETESVPVIEVLSESEIREEPESITMFPVVEPPRASVCMFVVAKFPAPVMYVLFAPELADIDAVGTPVPVLLVNAKRADDVAVPPNNTSYVEIAGDMAFELSCHRFDPVVANPQLFVSRHIVPVASGKVHVFADPVTGAVVIVLRNDELPVN